MPRYLVTFVYRLLDFRFAELDAILDMLCLDPAAVYAPSPPEIRLNNYSHLFVDLPSEAVAVEIQQRAVLVESVLELWGEGRTYEELDASLLSLSDDFLAPYMRPKMTWSLMVAGSGKTLSMAAQDTARYRVLASIPFPGPIQLKQPQETFWLIDHVANDTDPTPDHLYFGRAITSRASRGRERVGKGDLKRRAYLGPTSLDNELALLMASFAQIRPGSMVLDPFVGTGSILVACTQFGAFCVGTDIDIRVLRGKEEGRNVYANFTQYGLRYPELVRSDNALYAGHFRQVALYDAIVCDPPYGIRAGARRSGSRREQVRPVPAHLRADHIPQTRPYPMRDVLDDLLQVASTALRAGGRLVYLLPCEVGPEAGPEEGVVPTHEALDLVCVHEQKLNSKLVRKMVVMQKGEGTGDRGREGEEGGREGEGPRVKRQHIVRE